MWVKVAVYNVGVEFETFPKEVKLLSLSEIVSKCDITEDFVWYVKITQTHNNVSINLLLFPSFPAVGEVK